MRITRTLAVAVLAVATVIGGQSAAQAATTAPQSAPCIFWFICC